MTFSLNESNKVKDIFTTYLRYLDSTCRKRSKQSIKSIKSDLNSYCKFLDMKANNEVAEAFSETIILSYVAFKKKQGLSGRSISRHLSTLRQFFNWVDLTFKELEVVTNSKKIRGPKLPKLLPKALSVDEIAVFFSQKKKELETWLDYRDMAIFELAYSSGLRVTELVGIDLTHNSNSLGWINFEEMELEVLGKGNKWRKIPLGREAKNSLEEWVVQRESFLLKKNVSNKIAPLFINKFCGRLSPRGVQRRFLINSNFSTTSNRITPHMFRHSFASHILQSSKNLRAVQELLGHANISSTQIYTKLDYQHLAKIYDTSHPRARKLNENT